MPQPKSKPPFALAIHGGAGTILREKMTPPREKKYRNGLAASIAAGYKVLDDGGSALDATQAAVLVMEDDENFNAGKGAVYTHEGDHEQDACIMNGIDRSAGAAAGVKHVRNPIRLARAVLDHSPHVVLGGEGAEAFAKRHGIELVETEYFHTKLRRYQLQAAIEREKEAGTDQTQLDHSDDKADKIGTVGCVALDRKGNLAAATSTGGMTNKKHGRIGDTPLLGAGTWADNRTCAASATGHGEFIMRAVLSYDIAALMEYQDMSLLEASKYVIMHKFNELGGTGGVIAIDQTGAIALPFNTPGMYRAYQYPDSEAVISIFEDE